MNRTLVRSVAFLAALFWLPVSVFAQMCATESLAMKLAGHGQAVAISAERDVAQSDLLVALNKNSAVHSELATSATQAASVATVADGELLNDSHDGCEMAAVCALASLAVPVADDHSVLAFAVLPESVFHVPSAFTSRATSPDTPPPRHTR
jgi:hypothetical protein